MKTFSKALSMILVVVLCFGLFATSAYAMDILGDNSSSAGGGDLLGGSSVGYSGGDLLSGSGSFVSDGYTGYVDEANDLAANTGSYASAGNDLAANTAAGNDLAANTAAGNDLAANTAAGNDLAADTGSADNSGDLLANAAGGAAGGTDLLTLDNTATFNSGELTIDNTAAFMAFASATYNKSNPGTADIELTSSPADFVSFTYTTNKNGQGGSLLRAGVDYVINDSGTAILTRTFLNSLAVNTWYIYGFKDDTNEGLIALTVQESGSSDPSKDFDDVSGDTTWSPSHDFTKSSGKDINVTFNVINPATQYSGFAYSPNDTWKSPMNALGGNDYYITGKTVVLKASFLNSLDNGTYWLWGYKYDGNTYTVKQRIGYFTVNNGTIESGDWVLTPNYSVWYSGTDPLTFYCNIFEEAGKDWNFKGYGWGVIIPDIRYSTRADMSRATSVRIDQYWDLGYGYFMLGQNFLNSLSPEEVYYLQVVDARHPTGEDAIYSNVVEFRVGPTLRAIDTDKHVINSTRSLRFRSSSPVSEVYVGNIQLTDYADFGISYDGKTVTLSYEFLNNRTPGNTYNIKVRTTNGDYAATTFQILSTAQGSASPRTGDESNLGLWAAFLLLSGTAVVVLVPKLRKHDF